MENVNNDKRLSDKNSEFLPSDLLPSESNLMMFGGDHSVRSRNELGNELPPILSNRSQALRYIPDNIEISS